jgi:hypothetical protein
MESELVLKVHSLEREFFDGKIGFHEFRVCLDDLLQKAGF